MKNYRYMDYERSESGPLSCVGTIDLGPVIPVVLTIIVGDGRKSILGRLRGGDLSAKSMTEKVSNATSYGDIEELLDDAEGRLKDDDRHFTAFCTSRGQHVLICIDTELSPKPLSSLVHEAVHAADYIMDIVDFEGMEIRAYVTGAIYDHGAKLIEERNAFHERHIFVPKQPVMADSEGEQIHIGISKEEPKKTTCQVDTNWAAIGCKSKVPRDGE